MSRHGIIALTVLFLIADFGGKAAAEDKGTLLPLESDVHFCVVERIRPREDPGPPDLVIQLTANKSYGDTCHYLSASPSVAGDSIIVTVRGVWRIGEFCGAAETYPQADLRLPGLANDKYLLILRSSLGQDIYRLAINDTKLQVYGRPGTFTSPYFLYAWRVPRSSFSLWCSTACDDSPFRREVVRRVLAGTNTQFITVPSRGYNPYIRSLNRSDCRGNIMVFRSTDESFARALSNLHAIAESDYVNESRASVTLTSWRGQWVSKRVATLRGK